MVVALILTAVEVVVDPRYVKRRLAPIELAVDTVVLKVATVEQVSLVVLPELVCMLLHHVLVVRVGGLLIAPVVNEARAGLRLDVLLLGGVFLFDSDAIEETDTLFLVDRGESLAEAVTGLRFLLQAVAGGGLCPHEVVLLAICSIAELITVINEARRKVIHML